MVLLCVGGGGGGIGPPASATGPKGGAVRFKNTGAQAASKTTEPAEC